MRARIEKDEISEDVYLLSVNEHGGLYVKKEEIKLIADVCNRFLMREKIKHTCCDCKKMKVSNFKCFDCYNYDKWEAKE
jgi:hypothetical protein